MTPAPRMEKTSEIKASEVEAAVVPPSSVRRLFTNAGLYGVGSLVQQGVGVAMDPVLSYALSRADFGVLGLTSSLNGMLGATYTAGLDGAAGRLSYEVEHDVQSRRRVFGTLQSFLLGWLLVLTVLQEVFGPWIYARLFDNLPYLPYGRFVAAALLLNTITAIPRAAWAAAEDVRKVVGVRLAASLVGTVVLYVLLIRGGGPQAVLWADIVTPALVLVACLRWGAGAFDLAWDPKLLRAALAFGLPMIIHLTSHWALNAADRLVIEKMMGRDAVGLYSAAYKAIGAIITINLSINGAYVPQFMRAHTKPDQRDFVAQAVTWFLLSSAGATLALMAAAPSVLRGVYSAQFTEAADLIPTLCLGGVFQCIYLVFVNGLFFAKKTRIIPVATVLSGAANVGACLWLIPRFGLMGAAWATTLSYVVLATLVWAACRVVTPIPMQGGRLARLAAVFAACASAIWLLDHRLAFWPELGAKLAVLFVAPVLLLATGFFSAAERRTFLETFRKYLSRRRPPADEEPS